MHILENIPYGNDSRQMLDVYPSAKKDAPMVLFWYGGSWQRGDKRRYRFVGRFLQRAGYTAVIADYRLYPATKSPGFLTDAAHVVAWSYDQAEKYNANRDRIVMMGHSAGAHIAALVSYQSKWTRQQQLPDDVIKGYIGLAGPYDFYPDRQYHPIFDMDDTSQPWNPIRNVDRPQVPALLLHGRWDMLVEKGNALRFAAYLREHQGSAKARIYPYLEHMLIIVAFLRLFAWLPVQRDVRHFIARLFA